MAVVSHEANPALAYSLKNYEFRKPLLRSTVYGFVISFNRFSGDSDEMYDFDFKSNP